MTVRTFKPHSTRWAVTLVAILAITLPFEIDKPLFNLGAVVITNVEISLGLLLLTAVLGWLRCGLRPNLPRRLWIWVIFFIVTLLLTTILAPAHQSNAFKASLRIISGLMLALFAIPLLIRTWTDVRWIVWMLLIGGYLATLLGFIEYVQNHELIWLAYFRSQPTLAGGYIRLTGSFDYANQTAMFIEATFPILLCTIWLVWQKKSAVFIPLTLLALLYLQMSFLTFSRTSVVTIALVTLIVAVLLWYKQSQSKKKMSVLWLSVTIIVIILILLNTQFNSLFRLRLQTEGDNEWYNASLIVPEIRQMKTNETRTVPITLTNNGSLTWRSNGSSPINLGARWVDITQNLIFSEPRWAFTNPIAPGQQVEMNVTLQAPSEPGQYELIWDVVHEQISWFGAKTNHHVIHQVTIIQDEQLMLATPEQTQPSWQYPLPIPDRRTLWLAALTMLQERPFLGIGADNFRLTYGQTLGATSWNETIHSNNWYIETAVSLGGIGSLLIFAGMFILGIDIIHGLRQNMISIWQIAIGAGIIAFFIHGLLDFFILFNATGLLFWILIGLWITIRKTFTHPPQIQVKEKDANWI